MPYKRRSSTGALQFNEKQRRFSDSTKNFNKRIRTYSDDFGTPQRRGYTNYNKNFKSSSYFKGPTQQKRSGKVLFKQTGKCDLKRQKSEIPVGGRFKIFLKQMGKNNRRPMGPVLNIT